MNNIDFICFIVFLVIIEFGCTNSSNKSTIKSIDIVVDSSTTAINQEDTLPKLRAIPTTKNQIDKLLIDFCQPFNYEFLDLYVPEEKPREDDFLELDNPLKDNGFKITNTSRRNWQYGPRVISLTLEKGNCKCEVMKLYYGDRDNITKVTERITCNAIDLWETK